VTTNPEEGIGKDAILPWTEEEDDDDNLGRVFYLSGFWTRTLSQACCMLTPSHNTITPIAPAGQYKFPRVVWTRFCVSNEAYLKKL
jgi:hypothetical protein